MLTFAARIGEAIEQLLRDQQLPDSVIVVLVVGLSLLLLRDILASAIRPEGQPIPAQFGRISGRLYAQRSNERRRAWTVDPHARRPMRFTVTEWVGSGYTSPSVLRWQTRRAARRLRGNWVTARRPR